MNYEDQNTLLMNYYKENDFKTREIKFIKPRVSVEKVM